MEGKKQMNKFKIFSFFSGSGFLDLGFERSGYSVELVNEYSPAFMGAYKYSRQMMKMPLPKYGYHNIDVNDFLQERANELDSYMKDARMDGSLIGFIGGPPCPDFSIAGKQRGKNGDNGKLSLSYIQLIMKRKPDFFLFENVKGLWRTAKHRKFYEELKEQLSGSYWLTERLTNAIEFGAPQDRDRILLFGVNKDIFSDKKENPLQDFPWEKHVLYSLESLKKISWPGSTPFEENSQTVCPEGIPKELTVQYWFNKNDVEKHPNSKDCFTPRSGLAKMKIIAEGDDAKKSYKRLHRWRYSPTVAYGNNEVHLHPYKARRLTVAEALALQSLPKEFCLPPDMTLSDKFKTTGNGVPYLLSKGIAQTISEFLTEVVNNGKIHSV